MKIGLVDIDTSHANAWQPVEIALGHEIIGVCDAGTVNDREYLEDYTKSHNIPRLYESLEEMAADVDCAIIHSCNWDVHIERARPFIKAGKGVFIDKPMVGNAKDAAQLLAWAKEGKRITGGSSLLYNFETCDYLAIPLEERGAPQTVFCTSGTDEFNYGIHGYAFLSSIMGPGIRSVRHLGQGLQRRIQINWGNGRMGLLSIGNPCGEGKPLTWLPCSATVVSEKCVMKFEANVARLYLALLLKVLPYLAGIEKEAPCPMESLLEPELAAIAALWSWNDGDREVSLAEITGSDKGYNGKAFEDFYSANAKKIRAETR